MGAPRESEQPAGRRGLGGVPARVVGLLAGLLGPDLAGACVYGSAASGGLRPDSDLDLLAVAERSLADGERRELTGELLKVSGRRAAGGPARPVELTVVVRGDVVPWRYPPRCDFQYGEWLRDEYVAGRLPGPAEEPDLAVLLTTARDHAIVLAGAHPRDLLGPVPATELRLAIRDSLPALVADLPGDERNVVLTLARMVVTLETGEIVPKDVAAAMVQERDDGRFREVLALARAGYLGERSDDWSGLTGQLEAYVRHAAAAVERLT